MNLQQTYIIRLEQSFLNPQEFNLLQEIKQGNYKNLDYKILKGGIA